MEKNKISKKSQKSFWGSFKLGKDDKMIKDNSKLIEKNNHEVSCLKLNADLNDGSLIDKQEIIKEQLDNIESVKEDIDNLKERIEHTVCELTAKDKILNENRSDEDKLRKIVSDLRTGYDKKVAELEAAKKSLDYQDNFFGAKQNEKKLIEDQMKVMSLETTETKGKYDSIKYYILKIEKQIEELAERKNIHEEMLKTVQKEYEQQISMLTDTEKTFQVEMVTYNEILAKDQEIGEQIEEAREKGEQLKIEIQDVDYKKKEILYKLNDKEKEYEQLNIELSGVESTLTEKKFLNDSKHKKFSIVKANSERLEERLQVILKHIEDLEIESNDLDEEKTKLIKGQRGNTAQIGHLQTTLVSALEEVDIKKMEIDELSTEIVVFNTRISGTKERIEITNSKLYEFEIEHKNAVASKQEKIEEQGNLENKLRINLEAIQVYENKIVALNNEFERLQQGNIQLETDKRSSAIASNDLSNKIMELEKGNKEKLELKNSLGSEVCSIKKEVKGRGRELSDLSQKNKQMEETISKCMADKKDLEIHFKKIEREIRKAEEKREHVQRDMEEKWDVVSKKQREQQNLIKATKTIEIDIESYVKKIGKYSEQIQNHDSDCLKMESDITYAKRSLQISKDSVIRKESELQISKGVLKSKNGELLLVKKRLQDIEAQIPILEVQEKDWNNKLEKVDSETIHVSKLVDEKSHSIDTIRAKVNLVTKDNIQKMQELEEMDTDIIHLDNKLSFFESEFRIQEERQIFLKKQASEITNKLNLKQVTLTKLEENHKKKIEEVAAAKKRQLVFQKELKEVNIKALNVEAKIEEETAAHRRIIENSNGLPPVPYTPTVVNSSNNRPRDMFDLFAESVKCSYGNIHFKIDDTEIKKELAEGGEQLKSILNLIVDYIGSADKIIIGDAYGDIFIQFEVRLSNPIDFVQVEFEEAVKTERGSVNKLKFSNGLARGIILIRNKSLAPKVNVENLV